MSLIAIYLTKNQADILTDTLAHGAAGEYRNASSKHVVLHHLRMVIGTRGTSEALWRTFAVLNDMPLPGGIDDVLAPGHSPLKAVVGLLSWNDKHPPQLFLTGWSEGLRRMRLGVYNGGTVTEFKPPDLVAAPNDIPFMQQRSLPKNLKQEDLIKVAKEQRTWIRDTHGDHGAGGELFLTSLTPHSVATRAIHRFDNYETVKAHDVQRREAITA